MISPQSVWEPLSHYNGLTYVAYRGKTGSLGPYWVPTAVIDFSEPLEVIQPSPSQVFPNSSLPSQISPQQFGTSPSPPSPSASGPNKDSFAAYWKAYWEATGFGGIFMAVGGFLIALGVGSFMTTPTRIETRSGGPGVVYRTTTPGYVPTRSDIRRGWKWLFFGTIISLLGGCITYGPMAVYNTLYPMFLKAMS
jgi:hypothetical protein